MSVNDLIALLRLFIDNPELIHYVAGPTNYKTDLCDIYLGCDGGCVHIKTPNNCFITVALLNKEQTQVLNMFYQLEQAVKKFSINSLKKQIDSYACTSSTADFNSSF